MLFFERFMYAGGVIPIHCVMTARVRGRLDGENLRTALRKMQAKHPLLRARVMVEGGEPFFVMDDRTPEISLRVVERTSDVDWQPITVAEWAAPLDTAAGPLLRLIWIRSEEISELTMVTHHCICDGGSIMTLLRELLQVADQPDAELAPYTSYASLKDLVPASVLLDKKTRRRISSKAALYKAFLLVAGGRKPALTKGEPYALYWRADAEEFAAMNGRCAREDTTLYAALCVAFLRAFREVQGSTARNRIMCPVSIRRFIRTIKSDMLFAFAPTIQLSLPAKQADFWELAREMKRSIAEKIESLKVYEELMVGDRMLSWVPRLFDFLSTSRGGHDLAFSNMGRLKIPLLYKNFRLEAVIGATLAVPWRNTNTLIASQFAGEMELSFISNERFLPQTEALAIRQRALQLLNEAVGS